MKLKKVASICSKTKIFCLYDREESGGEVSQWLGDSSAIYPITGLPYMDEENIYSMFDISAKQQEKIIFRHQRAPEGINLSDTDPTEHRIDEESLSLVYDGGVLKPLQTRNGISFMPKKRGRGGKTVKLYDAKAVARFLDVSERRVRQLRDEKVIAEVRPGLYDLIDTNHRYINYLRKRNPESEETIDYNTERAKLVRAKRKNEEYELQLKENTLHAAADIEAVMTDMLVNFKSRLMAIPSKLAPVLCKKTDKAEIFALLKDHIDEALMELSDFKTTFGERGNSNEKSDG